MFKLNYYSLERITTDFYINYNSNIGDNKCEKVNSDITPNKLKSSNIIPLYQTIHSQCELLNININSTLYPLSSNQNIDVIVNKLITQY